MLLLDQATGVVDGFGAVSLVKSGLKTTVQEFFEGQVQAQIESGVSFFEETESDQTAEEGTTFEDALGVLANTTKNGG